MAASSGSGIANDLNGIANEALVAYTFVDLGGTTAVETMKFSTADSGDIAIGVCQNTCSSGDPVIVAGPGKVALLTVLGNSANIAAGDRLKPDASNTGKGIKTTTDTNWYGAIALEPATADDVIIRVLVLPGYVAG